MKKQWIVLPMTMMILLLSSVTAQAGGWVVVTLDELPSQLQAGQTITLGFTIQQHGREPINMTGVELLATPTTGRETLTFAATQQGAKGHYQVTVTLPTAGEWQWEIQPGGFPTVELAAMTVVPAAASSPQSPAWQPWVLRGLPILLVNHSPLVVGGARAALLLLTVRQEKSQPAAAPVPTGQMLTYGRALFAAKGCTSCHLHGAVSSGWSSEAGPNLTHYTNSADYLRTWLKDPQAVKPQTAMPNLQLQTAEIEALAAFLTAPSQ